MPGGVDGFLILSGLGCYYSYHKTKNLKKYYIKRIKRILPTYIFVTACYAVFCVLIVKNCTLSQYLYTYSLVTFWTNGVLKEWYVAALIVLYIVSPLMFILVDKNKSLYLVLTAAVMIVTVFLGVIKLPNTPAIINEVFGCRIPAFMFGIFSASVDTDTVRIRMKNLFTKRLLLLGVVSAVWVAVYNTGLPCKMILLRLLCLPLWTELLSIVSIVADHTHKKYRVLSSLGVITFELYLLHDKMLGITYYICHRLIQNPLISSIMDNLLAISFSIIGASIIHKIMNYSINRIYKSGTEGKITL